MTISKIGLSRVAAACHVSPSAVHRWKAKNRLPRTEYTGETRYAEAIAGLDGSIEASALLALPTRAG